MIWIKAILIVASRSVIGAVVSTPSLRTTSAAEGGRERERDRERKKGGREREREKEGREGERERDRRHHFIAIRHSNSSININQMYLIASALVRRSSHSHPRSQQHAQQQHVFYSTKPETWCTPLKHSRQSTRWHGACQGLRQRTGIR